MALPLAGALLTAGCANPAYIAPIEGRTFIVENHSRQEVWDAAWTALDEEGKVGDADFQAGEMRGYYGESLNAIGMLITMSQLYPGEDIYTVAVAGRAPTPLIDSETAEDALAGRIQEILGM